MKRIGFIACSFSAIIALFGMIGCTDEDGAYQLLFREGYTNIQFTGYDWMACSEDDTYHTGFKATNMKGNQVSGVVCCGYIKACTIRYH